MTQTSTAAAAGPARRDRQALPWCRRQPRRLRRRPRRHRARAGRRERRGQVDADEDPLRRAEARRRHHRGQRHAGHVRLAGRRHQAGDRDGVPALPAGRQPHRHSRTSCSAPRSCTASATGPRREIERISAAYGFDLDPDELVETLGVGERQRVEILKVLYRGARIIILDEPTAVLVPQEVEALFRNLRELSARATR